MTTLTNTRSLRMTRIYAAAPERVFDAWLSTDWGKWAGPRGVHGEVVLMEPHVGGRYRMLMHAPDGKVLTVGGTYLEITRPSRLVMDWRWDHEAETTRVTLSFRAVAEGTKLTMLHERFGTESRRDDHGRGWTGTLDRLADHLAEG